MGALSIWHIVIIGVIALILFGGRGKVSDLMGDFGKGINNFKAGLNSSERVANAIEIPAITESAAAQSTNLKTSSPLNVRQKPIHEKGK